MVSVLETLCARGYTGETMECTLQRRGLERNTKNMIPLPRTITVRQYLPFGKVLEGGWRLEYAEIKA
jgi:hypothetical protein